MKKVVGKKGHTWRCNKRDDPSFMRFEQAIRKFHPGPDKPPEPGEVERDG